MQGMEGGKEGKQDAPPDNLDKTLSANTTNVNKLCNFINKKRTNEQTNKQCLYH